MAGLIKSLNITDAILSGFTVPSILDTLSVRWYVRDMYGGTTWEDPEYPGIPTISRDLLWQHMTSLTNRQC